MRQLYLCWPEEQTLQTASAESAEGKSRHTSPSLEALTRVFPLPWSAYVCLLSVKDSSARTFYGTEALRCGWSVRQLDRQINSLFYERTALSRDKLRMLERG